MHADQVEAVEVVEPGVEMTSPEDEGRLVDVCHTVCRPGTGRLAGGEGPLPAVG